MIQKPDIVVLDTNVCLDLFVFYDPRWAALLAALRNGTLQAITREDCRREWQLVLNYKHLPPSALLPATQTDFDALIPCLPMPVSECDIRLPVCSDPDDQKFLELAYQSGAQYLITKDKALLKCAGKARRSGLFAIIPPQAWALADENKAGTTTQAGFCPLL
ncbi:putative toxin-antitoxin system toxin component, PIN family [Herbaspirillum sp. RTI4]|uniref:putative toxin-antitoxin system toxin component, PIN family n=1 Tax=Herbaspirillum sp. RTI4 TaxID=3048640 RepID=UPI002AB413C2|nr:putative toxin-antitoxin system toxin component, PIN family [Herbaspirillum sp. RTI4]MDY7578559.1 putative toxin-antitoxin system toxin component, PIN family [Herbaspirillum sp. RTI4]MEA9981135.1 putative toxin-antitoxin system toxin component, PIN family [Herbaspirillum sp. RTI4]